MYYVMELLNIRPICSRHIKHVMILEKEEEKYQSTIMSKQTFQQLKAFGDTQKNKT